MAEALATASDIATVVGAATLLGTVLAFRRGATTWIIARTLHRHLRPVFRDVDGLSRRKRRQVFRHRARALASAPTPPSPAEELAWLQRVLRRGSHLPVGYVIDDDDHALGAADEHVTRDEVIRLMDAYRSAAGEMRGRSAFGSSLPIIGAEASRYLATAEILNRYLDGICHARPPALSLREPHRELDLVAFSDLGADEHGFELVVSWSPDRSVLEGAEFGPNDPGPQGELEFLLASDGERHRAREAVESRHAFDGVLPRIVQWRTEHDRANGRQRLHLALAECSYSACLIYHHRPAVASCATSTNGDQAGRGIGDHDDRADGSVGLVTLALGVVTTDGTLLLAKRSGAAGSHRNLFGASVNGNLELAERPGLRNHRDQHGMPDPRLAIVAEAAEELGLVLDPSDVVCSGLARFTDRRERGTWLLTFVTHVSASTADVAAMRARADPLEGKWELTGEFERFDIGGSADRRARLAAEALDDPTLTTHALIIILMALGRAPVERAFADCGDGAASRSRLVALLSRTRHRWRPERRAR